MQRKHSCDSACSLFPNTEAEVAKQSKTADCKTASDSMLETNPSSLASPSFTWQNKNINFLTSVWHLLPSLYIPECREYPSTFLPFSGIQIY